MNPPEPSSRVAASVAVVVVVILAVLAVLILFAVIGGDPAEDDPDFDCTRHGNERCGPTLTHPRTTLRRREHESDGHREVRRRPRPRCDCHGEEMRWAADSRQRAGGRWVCAVRTRQAQRRYDRTTEGKAAQRRYQQSPKGRAAQRRYETQRRRGRSTTP